MKRLILTGFMGTGKSTVGRLLADRFGLDVIDIDAEIERRTGRTIRGIFEADGEDSFRAIESTVFREALQGESDVVVTGGGTLVSPDNRSRLNDGETVLVLTCSTDELQSRLEGVRDRPLMPSAGRDAIEALLRRRAEVYGMFPQIDTTGRSPDEVVSLLASGWDVSEAAFLRMERSFASAVIFERGAAFRSLDVSRGLASARQILVVVDGNVATSGSAGRVIDGLRSGGAEVSDFVIEPGEESKQMETVMRLYHACLSAGFERHAYVVGLGGGMVCDVAAFVAATYMRGIRLVLLPTTLLAQVDAAIGGKAGVDLDGAKNMVGAFYPAEEVILDPDLLTTLPSHSFSDGMAEVVKISCIRSKSLFEKIEKLRCAKSVLDAPTIIRRAASEKVRVVQDDPFEHGIRGLLNFGHTVGHAIESASDFALAHGQAVAIGMRAEARLAADLQLCSPEIVDRLDLVLDRMGLARNLPGLDMSRVTTFLLQDKKRRSGHLRFALPTGLGRGEMVEVTHRDAAQAFAHAQGAMS